MLSLSTPGHIIGGLPPPPGVTPNFVNPDNLNTEWYVVMSLCLGFSTIFVLIRAYTKLVIIKSLGWEDYTSFLAWLGLISYIAVDVVAFSHGAGKHQWNVSIEQVQVFVQVANVKEIINGPVIYVVKLSILLQFMRIFVPRRTGTAYYSIQSVNWLNLLFYTAATLVNIFCCVPRHKLWEPWTPGRCVNIPRLIIASAFINVISDVAMFMIPLFCISSLQMPRRRKIGLAVVFATGVFARLTSIIRTQASFRFAATQDVTYVLCPLAFWSDAEIASGIVCGCMPVVPKFFRHLVPKIKSQFGSSPSGKSESAFRAIPIDAANRVDRSDEYHKLKGKGFDFNLHSLLRTTNVGREDIESRDDIESRSREPSNGSITHGLPTSDLESGLDHR